MIHLANVIDGIQAFAMWGVAIFAVVWGLNWLHYGSSFQSG